MKGIILSIPESCHENWDNMLRAAGGRNCAACAKIVVDFTGMSDQDIIEHLAKNTNVCGRIKKSQLDRPMYPLTPMVPVKRNWMAIAAMIVAGTFIISPSFGQTIDSVKFNTEINSTRTILEKDFIIPNIHITGSVMDAETLEPLWNCTIEMAYEGKPITRFITDENGEYKLSLDYPVTNGELTLTFSSVGYHKTVYKIPVDSNGVNVNLKVKLKEGAEIFVGLIITNPTEIKINPTNIQEINTYDRKKIMKYP